MRRSIDIGNPKDMRFWAGVWGLSDQELIAAVGAAGPNPGDVAAHIGQPLGENWLLGIPKPPNA
jgi:hypothetical protein